MKKMAGFQSSKPFTTAIMLTLCISSMATLSMGDVIIDNGESGTSYTGSWTASSATGYYGTNSLWARNGATYTWTMSSQSTGEYEVFMWWSAYSSRATSISVVVTHASGQETLTINQQLNGSQWNSLGTYTFDGTGSVTITAASGTTVSTCADAVWFQLISSPPTASIDSITPNPADVGETVTFNGSGTDTDGTIAAYSWTSDIDGNLSDANSFSTSSLSEGTHTITFQVQDNDGEWSDAVSQTLTINQSIEDTIIDNGDTATSSTGTWAVSGATNPYGTNSVWSYSGATYTWTFTPATTGTYQLSMWWTALTSRSSSVPVTIQHSGGTASTTINQQANGGMWNEIGEYTFTAGTSYTVTITAPTGSPPSTCADAVKFSPVLANVVPTAVIDSITPNPGTYGEAVQFTGHGTDSDGTITAYSWTSSIDGALSDANSFSTSALSAGTHTIIFEVQDDDGEWSTEVLETLTIGYPATEIIIDNGDANTSFTGSWYASSATGAYGPNSLFGGNNATYTWTFAPQISGTYSLSMWWTALSTRSSSVPVSIQHSGGTASTTINQQTNGGMWNEIGEYTFNAGTTYNVTITAGSVSPPSTCADAVNFTLVTANSEPVATIDSISPNPATYGQNVQFSGHGSDTDGTIAAYKWESDIDGDISDANGFTASALSIGTHTISFEVQDNGGLWSDPVSQTLTIEPTGNVLPIATITSMTPNPTTTGTTVEFIGTGTDSDGTVIAYRWTSSINGIISTEASFSLSTLSPGTHTISFKVQDDNGEWSTAATQTLTISQTMANIISDNGDSGTSSTSNWQISSASSPYGANSLYSSGGATYTWSFTAPTTGTYQTYLWWTSLTTRSTAVPYAIVHDGGTTTISVDQRSNGGQWNSKGTYAFTAGQTYTIRVTAQSSTNASCADAVRWQLVSTDILPTAQITSITPNPTVWGQSVEFCGAGFDSDGTISVYEWTSSIDGTIGSSNNFTTSSLTSGTHTISLRVQDNSGNWSTAVTQSLIIGATDTIIDNGSANTEYTGTWYPSTASGYYGTDSLWSRNGTTYTFKFTPSMNGNYEVFGWWTAYTSRSSSVPITIVNAGGTDTVTINQQTNGGQWNSLGVFPFQSGITYSITITAVDGSTISTCADAMKFVYSGVINIPLPPAAEILTITPNPGMPDETIVFTGKATDSDGNVVAYNWRSDIDGTLGTTRILNKTLTAGTHTVYFKAQDDSGLWSSEVSATVDVGLEHIYIALCYGGNEIGKLSMTSVLQTLGATQSSTYEWTYTDPNTGKIFYIHFVRNYSALAAGMKRDGSHIIISSHSNYGLGYIFSTSTEDSELMIDDIRYVDDNRIIKFGTPMAGVSAYGMRTGQAYPYWWPIYQDGTSAIAPYDFNDANGHPAYNYYLTYQVPGDSNYYKVETVNNSAIQRFSDSSVSAWYSITGAVPDVNKYEDRQYFITNSESWSPSIESSGVWTQYQELPANKDDAEYFKENYVYKAAGSGSDYMRFMFTIPSTGQYKVSAWWPTLSTNATDAPYRVYHSSGSTLLTMDQTTNGQCWNDLGTYTFNAGDYLVLLTDAASSGNVIADGVRIGHINNPNDVVESDFIAMPMSGEAPLSVMFVNNGTGDLTGRTWNCGDGYTNTTRDLLNHEYVNPGTYSVTLTVKGPMGTSTKTKTGYITVWAEGANYTAPLKAEFGMMNKFSTTSLYNVPLAAIFMDASDGNVVSRLWTFGDGATSTEQNPVHIYTNPGNYTVSLTVTNADNETSTETKQNFVRAVVYEKNIDNVDYPKTSYGGWVGKTMLKTKTVDITKDQLKYGRMLLESCNSGDYYIQTVAHSKMFYTVGSSTGEGSLTYLYNYLLGYSDYELWESIQQVEAVYDYYDFNLLPSEQSAATLTSLTTLSAATVSIESSRALTSEEQADIEEMKSLSLLDVFETLSTPEYMVDEQLSSEAVSQAYSGSEEQAVELAIARVKTPVDSADGNGIREMKTAKLIIKEFSDISIPRIIGLYPQKDAAVNGNLITAAGVLAGDEEIKAMLIEALDDQTDTADEPEIGQPLRICDTAYNQLILNLKIKGVLRTIGTGMDTETRDYHIGILKTKL